MKLFCKLIFFVIISNNCLLAADKDIKSLVNQLGAESYQEREKATQEIWALGQEAIEELRLAANSNDPEISDRAKELINRIELGVTPDTPKEFVATLKKFNKIDREAQGKMLIELSRQKGGWLIIKALLLKDFDQNLADLILSQVDTNMILGLRDKGHHQDAGAVLELAIFFNTDSAWVYSLASFADETGTQKALLDRFTKTLKQVPQDKKLIQAAIHHTMAITYRSLGDYESASTASQALYKIAFSEDSDSLKELCKPLFIDCHLLAEKYAYLEQFWAKTSLDIPEKERTWNILWLQKMQGKTAEFNKTKETAFKLMNNKDDYITLVTVLLLNSQIDDAKKLLIKYENFETLAEISRSNLNYLQYEKNLVKAATQNKDIKLQLLAFEARNKGNIKVKAELNEAVLKRENPSEKLTAIIFLSQAGFKKEATKYLNAFLKTPSITENDSLRAAWALTESQPLAELFLLLKDKSKSKKIDDAIELITLLALTEDADSFVEYAKMLEEKFEGYSREMKKITSILGNYCLDKGWNASAAAVMSLLEPSQRGLFNSLLESEARIRNKEYTKAVHNLLGPSGTPKISLPYYLVAQAYSLSGEDDKRKKALEYARSYDMGRESIISMTSQYLYENGHYDYFLETAEKLCRTGSAMSPYRIRAYRLLSSSHIHNLKHNLAKPSFMAYYKLVSSDLSLLEGGPSEALRLAYQYNEFMLRDAVNKNKDNDIEKFSKVCESLFLNNIEVPILLKESKNKTAQRLHKLYFTNQWQHMTKSIKHLPNHAILLNSAAWLGALQDYKLEECLKMVQKAIDLEPSAANYDTRAEVEFRLKHYKEALESIEKAASLDKLEPFFRERVEKFRKAAESAQ